MKETLRVEWKVGQWVGLEERWWDNWLVDCWADERAVLKDVIRAVMKVDRWVEC